MGKKQKSALLINIEYYIAIVLVKIASLMPMRLAYVFSGITCRLFFFFDKKHRNRTVQHLLHSGIAKDHQEAINMAKKNLRHFAVTGIEIIKLAGVFNEGNIRDYVTPTGSPETVEKFLSPGKKASPAIIVTAHYGNWELAGPTYTSLTGHDLLTVMRPLNNPKIGDFIYKRREADKHKTCPKNGALKALLGALKKGSSVCIMGDQHASTTEGVETTFFGHPARTHSSPALLHLKTGVPIIVMASRRTSDDFKFDFVCSDPIEFKPTGNKEADIREIAQLYTNEIEKLISGDPKQWLWAHRRWLDINR